MTPALQRIFVDDERGNSLGQVIQREDGQWTALLRGMPIGVHHRPADADRAVRREAEFRSLHGRQGAKMR